MKSGLAILLLLPVGLVLVIVNCVSWVTKSLRTANLPVEMGIGWPQRFYTYPVNRVGETAWNVNAGLIDLAVALGILIALWGMVFLFTRTKKEVGWR